MRRIFALLIVVLFQSSFAQAEVALLNRQGVGITSQQFHFTDENQKDVDLTDYFARQKPVPVILVLAYYGCPGVCTVLLNRLTSTLKLILPSVGKAFEVVVLSIDPHEKSELARSKKQSYIKLYSRPETAAGWHYLVGSETEIKRLSQTLGFFYEYDPSTQVFSHPSAVFVFTPQGILSSVLSGTDFTRKELQFALFEAERGKVRAFLDRLGAYCYAYLPHRGILNTPDRWLIAGFGATALAWMIVILFKFKSRRQRHSTCRQEG